MRSWNCDFEDEGECIHGGCNWNDERQPPQRPCYKRANAREPNSLCHLTIYNKKELVEEIWKAHINQLKTPQFGYFDKPLNLSTPSRLQERILDKDRKGHHECTVARDGIGGVSQKYIETALDNATFLLILTRPLIYPPPLSRKFYGKRRSDTFSQYPIQEELCGFVLGKQMLVGTKETFYIDLICSNNRQTGVLLMASEIYAAVFLNCSLIALRAATNQLINYYGKRGYERYVDACTGTIGYNYRDHENRTKKFQWRRPKDKVEKMSPSRPSLSKRSLRSGIGKKSPQKSRRVVNTGGYYDLEKEWDTGTGKAGERLFWMSKCIEGLKGNDIDEKKKIAGSRYYMDKEKSWPGFDNVYQMVEDAVVYQSGYNDPAFLSPEQVQVQGHLGMCRHGMTKEVDREMTDELHQKVPGARVSYVRCVGTPDHVWASSRDAKMEHTNDVVMGS